MAWKHTPTWVLVGGLASGLTTACTQSSEDTGDPTFTAGDDTDTGTDTGTDTDAGTDTDTGTETGVMCTEPLTECGGECVDLEADVAHCGACDNTCAAEEQCEVGVCTGKLWRGAELLEFDDVGDAQSPGLSSDAAGNAVVAWSQSDGSPLTHIGAIRYDREANEWANAKPIEFDNAGGAFKPRVSVATDGNAVAVWEQSNGGFLQDARSNRYDAATDSWGSVSFLESDNFGDATNPQITSAGNGTAFAVWTQTAGSSLNVWSNRYHVASNTWLGAELIESDTLPAFFPQICADDVGNAIAVWIQWDGTRNNVWSNRYDGTTDMWGAPALVEQEDLGTTAGPQVACMGDGNAWAIWVQNDGVFDNVMASRFDAATATWGPATLVETEDGDATRPHLGVSATGDVFATWMQYDGQRFNVWSNFFDAAKDTWGREEVLEQSDEGNAWDPQVSVEPGGSSVFVWAQDSDVTRNIWAKRYDAGTMTWSEPTLLEEEDAGDAQNPQVATDATGQAYVVWTQFDGTRISLYANVFR